MKKIILIPVLILIIGLASAIVWYFKDDLRQIPYAPSVRAQQWSANFSRSDLHIRKVKKGEPAFLFKPVEREKDFQTDSTSGAYSYSPDTQELKFVPQEVWDKGEGEIIVCPFNLSNSPPRYSTYGSYTLSAMDSTGLLTDEKIAVISASGPRLPGISLFGLDGQGRVAGTRYFEVFDQTKSTKSQVFRLQGLKDELTPLICWTKEKDFVVVYSSYFTDFSVINITAIEAKETK